MNRKRQHDFPQRVPEDDGMHSGDRESPHTDRLVKCAHCGGSGKSTSACCHAANGTKYDGLWGGRNTRCCSCSGAGKVRV